jgi:antirestriction protein ArdC
MPPISPVGWVPCATTKAIFNAAAQAQAAADWIHAAHKAAITPLAIAA